MSKKVFNAEEMASLAANPYTSRVTAKQIAFTKEFRERFWGEYCEGKTPSEIVKGCGYSVETLGERRIGGIREHIRQEFANSEGFQGGGEKGAKKQREPDGESSEDAIRQMRLELQYMRKELDFLKKIISIRGMRK